MTAKIRQWGNSAGVRIPKEIMVLCNLNLNDDLEMISFEGGIKLQKKEMKTFVDVAKPILYTDGWKFDREEANERN